MVTFWRLRPPISGTGVNAGKGVTQNGSTYTVSPNGIGLATYDNWNGTLATMPAASDVVSYHTVIPGGGIGSTHPTVLLVLRLCLLSRCEKAPRPPDGDGITANDRLPLASFPESSAFSV